MSELNSKSIPAVLDALNEELANKNLHKELQIFGSGALILLNHAHSSRETHDIDILSPTGDMELLRASELISQKFNLNIDWLNSIGSIFIRHLPQDWGTRLQLVYEKSNLKIYSLSDADLLFTKVKAYYNRGMENDLKDIVSLKASAKDLQEIFNTPNYFSDKKRLAEFLLDLKEAYEEN